MKKEDLLNEFLSEFKIYKPDWQKIIDINQFPEDYSNEQMRLLKLKKFGEAMHALRMNYPGGSKSLRDFAELVPFSHTYINDIENNKIKSLPVPKLETIAKDFSTSVAYLIGLIDDMHCKPSNIDLYFWENPKSKYNPIKEDIYAALPEEKTLHYMIQKIPGIPIEELKKRICKLIGTDYELANSIYILLSGPQKKRYNIIKIFEYLKNI